MQTSTVALAAKGSQSGLALHERLSVFLVAATLASACSGSLPTSHDDDGDSGSGGAGGEGPGEGGSGGIDPPEPGACESDGDFAGPLVRRLSHTELRNTIEDLLGIDASAAAGKLTPPSISGGLFSNHAAALDVPSQLSQGYANLAKDVAAKAIAQQGFVSRHTPCSDSGSEECARSFIESLGKRLMRRPLSEEEGALYKQVFDTARQGSLSFADGATLVLEGMLQSPKFLYRVEKETVQGENGWRTVDSYEMASRLSFLLWAAAPDDELLSAADNDELTSAEGIAKQVDRMLADPRSSRNAADFGGDWMRLQSLPSITLSAPVYRDFDDKLKGDMIAETKSFFSRIWQDDAPWTELLQRRSTKISKALASLYGADVGDDKEAYELPSVNHRRGILTQASILSITAHGDTPQMVHRGLFILRNFLCSDVPQPSDSILQKIEDKKEQLPANATQREQAIDRMNDKDCGSCHGFFDPLAMVLEPFDSMGRFRERDENDRELLTNWTLDLGDGPKNYAGIDDYTDLLVESDDVRFCMAEKAIQFAVGRQVDRTQEACLMQTVAAALENGGTFRDAFAALARSPRFRRAEVTAE